MCDDVRSHKLTRCRNMDFGVDAWHLRKRKWDLGRCSADILSPSATVAEADAAPAA